MSTSGLSLNASRKSMMPTSLTNTVLIRISSAPNMAMTIYMREDTPDFMSSLRLHDFFTSDEKERIIERTLMAYGSTGNLLTCCDTAFKDTRTRTTRTSKFDMLEEPQRSEPSPLGIVMEGVGASSRSKWSTAKQEDIINARDEAFGNVLRAPLSQRTAFCYHRVRKRCYGKKKRLSKRMFTTRRRM